jgi:hypothetical protein
MRQSFGRLISTQPQVDIRVQRLLERCLQHFTSICHCESQCSIEHNLSDTINNYSHFNQQQSSSMTRFGCIFCSIFCFSNLDDRFADEHRRQLCQCMHGCNDDRHVQSDMNCQFESISMQCLAFIHHTYHLSRSTNDVDNDQVSNLIARLYQFSTDHREQRRLAAAFALSLCVAWFDRQIPSDNCINIIMTDEQRLR